MKALKKRGFIFEFALVFLMLLAVALVISLPWSIPAITQHVPHETGLWFEKYMILLAISGLLALVILWQARCIVHIISKGNPFVQEMVRRMRTIGIDCLILAAFYCLSIFVITTFFMIVVFITFSVIGFIMLIFSQIFRQAILFKEENDRVV